MLVVAAPRGARASLHGVSVLVADAQWAMLEPLLPPPGNTAGRGGRPEKHYRRMILDTILHLVWGRIAWRQLPADFPPPTTVYDVFTQWVRAGGGGASTTRCETGCGCGPDEADARPRRSSTRIPARRRHGAPIQSRWDCGKRTNGRTRHLAAGATGLLRAGVVTAASIEDREAAFRLLARLRDTFSTIRLVWADGGYPRRLIGWANQVVALRIQIIKRIPGQHRIPRAAPGLVCGADLRLDQQASPLRPRL